MNLALVQEKERRLQERNFIVRFEVNGRPDFVEILAEPDCDESVYYDRAKLAYRRKHRGESIDNFVGIEVIEIRGSFDLEPPRPDTRGYRHR
jgi:hypothetical protein